MVASKFAVAFVLIMIGALFRHVSHLHFQLVIVAFFEVMFFSANEALNIHVLKTADIGDSMLITPLAFNYFGIAASLVLLHEKAILYYRDHSQNSTIYRHSDLLSIS